MDQRDQVSDWHVTQLRAAEDLRYLYLKYEHTWKDILLRGHNPQSYHTKLTSFYDIERDIQSAIEDITREPGLDNPSKTALQRFEQEFFQAGRLYRRALRTYNEDISDSQFAADAVTHDAANDPVRRNTELIEALEVSRHNSYQKITRQMQRFEQYVALIVLFLICVFLISVYYLSNRFIISPISRGISLAEDISRGELENNFEIEHTTTEITKLMQSLKRMQANINHARKENIAAREQAEQSSTAKSAFLSRMSHELRTPLHAILGFGQILQLQPESLNSRQKNNVDKIIEAGQHLLDLINEVLDLARIENNKLDMSIENVGLSEIVAECITLTSPLAQQKSISLINLIPAQRHYVIRADTLRFKQALINLISNAIKYGFVQGSVIVDCQETLEHDLRIEVTDDGPGIPVDKQQLLFKPFERLDEKQFVEGTGVGLALTKKLVELMQGKTGVKSEPGKGSTFWIQFKLTDAAQLDNHVIEPPADSLTSLQVDRKLS
jgi:signal transduction histidine kinase